MVAALAPLVVLSPGPSGAAAPRRPARGPPAGRAAPLSPRYPGLGPPALSPLPRLALGRHSGASVLVPLWLPARSLADPAGHRADPGVSGRGPPTGGSSSPLRPLRLLVWGGLLLGVALALALAELAGLSQPALVMGLTLVLAGHTERRTGSSLLSKRPGYFLLALPGLGRSSAGSSTGSTSSCSSGSIPAPVPSPPYPSYWCAPSTTDPVARPPGPSSMAGVLAGRSSSGWSRATTPGDSGWVRGRRAAGCRRTWLALAGLGLVGAAIWPDCIWPLTWLRSPAARDRTPAGGWSDRALRRASRTATGAAS